MIRVHKHNVAPSSLAMKKVWDKDDVQGQLKFDQHGKCYLCERLQVTDFEIEHFKSRKNFPELTFEWTNLLWSCGYCNRKKSASGDNLLNPISENIEELIYQAIDFPNAKAVFQNMEVPSDKVDLTISLLAKIFNGSKSMRTMREQQFYDYAMSRITSFQEMTLLWLKSRSEDAKRAIIEELDIKSEFLGFKYWIIQSNKALREAFEDYLIWNKSTI